MAVQTALVISGGGSKGAFAVGAIEVLRAHNITFDLVTGTSTGALIAPLVATDEIPLLRHIYSTVRTQDVLTRRPGVIDILASDSIYDTSPLWTLINAYITDARYQKILAAHAEIELCSVNLQSGQVTYFNPKRGVDGKPMPRDVFNKAILASASQPVLMPSVRVPTGDQFADQFVDGGVREVTPLRRAVDAGATEIYAIVLSPEKQQRQARDYVFVVDTLLRTLDLLLTEVSIGDLRDAIFYNQALSYLGRVRDKVSQRLSATEVADAFEDGNSANPFSGRRTLALRIIRPTDELPSDGLTFSPLLMSEMMAMGTAAAQQLFQSSANP
jgi:predicted acylesterase/phospholipase RssA